MKTQDLTMEEAALIMGLKITAAAHVDGVEPVCSDLSADEIRPKTPAEKVALLLDHGWEAWKSTLLTVVLQRGERLIAVDTTFGDVKVL